jgi:IS4 transposase
LSFFLNWIFFNEREIEAILKFETSHLIFYSVDEFDIICIFFLDSPRWGVELGIQFFEIILNTRLLSDSEKLAVLFVKISFCYVLCNEGFL